MTQKIKVTCEMEITLKVIGGEVEAPDSALSAGGRAETIQRDTSLPGESP